MKTVIPERVIHHCDKCKKEISANRIKGSDNGQS